MGNGKRIIDQIQDALRGMEASGFLDELADQSDAEGGAEEKATPTSDRPDALRRPDESSS